MLQPEAILPTTLFDGLDRSGPEPLYRQVSARLERAIRDEILPAGGRLESEVALAHRLALSRPTVRRAIRELVDRGLLVRRRGIGTIVVHGRIARGVELSSLFDDLVHADQHPHTRVLAASTEAADHATAALLGVSPGSPVTRLRRLRFADGVPLAILQNTLPGRLSAATIGRLRDRGLYAVLREGGTLMAVARQRIGARSATAEESELLGLTPGAALLTMERTAFDADGRVVEHGHHCYAPDRYGFDTTLVSR